MNASEMSTFVFCSEECPVSLEKLSLSDAPNPKAPEQHPAEDLPVNAQTDRK